MPWRCRSSIAHFSLPVQLSPRRNGGVAEGADAARRGWLKSLGRWRQARATSPCCRATARLPAPCWCYRPSRRCGTTARWRPGCRPARGRSATPRRSRRPTPPSRSGSARGASSATRRRSRRHGREAPVAGRAPTRRAPTAIVEAICLARDLITTPSSDMGPAELADAARGARRAARRQAQGHRRRRAAEAELPDDPCRRPRQRARAAADRPRLGQAEPRRR